jgi:hypothetical protein
MNIKMRREQSIILFMMMVVFMWMAMVVICSRDG